MRLRFYLAERNLRSPHILTDIADNFSSWPLDGLREKDHIEVHLSEKSVAEFQRLSEEQMTQFREFLEFEQKLSREVPIKYYLVEQRSPFLIHSVKDGAKC